MSEMVERVAHAIYARQFGTAMAGILSKEEAEIFARAAIQAMHSPDGAMMCAGMLALDDALKDEEGLRCSHLEVWQAMTEAALSEDK